MGKTASYVFDKFGSLSIQMGIFIGLFICDGTRGIVEFTNVSPSDRSMFFDELGKNLLEKFVLVLMVGDLIFKCLNFI